MEPFTQLDARMRVYEKSLDQVLLPETYMAARLDGRGFTKLTKKECAFKTPFDETFRDMMVLTARHLMDCGFRVIYAYTESDEISLLFDPRENTFGRKVRKYNSTLAGEASAFFSLLLKTGRVATFDCRIIPLPTAERVQDYFIWRQEDANRNALNAHCYWMLRREGLSAGMATSALKGKGVSFKNELLFGKGVNYNDVPAWQKRGVGIWKEPYIKEGYNPITKETVSAVRTRFCTEYELPFGDAYRMFIADILSGADSK